MALDIHLYSRATRPTTAEERAVEILRTRLQRYKKHVRHAGVRLDESMSPRGGGYLVCRVTVELTSNPKLFVEGLAPTATEAVDLAAGAVDSAIRRELGLVEPTPIEGGRAAKPSRSELVTPRARKASHPPRGRHVHKTQHQARATSARELTEEGARPSRKSTRKSANRSKRDANQQLRVRRAMRSAENRAAA